MEPSVELGSAPGVALNVYVSATPEIDPNGVGVESGNYVIIEVNTDYQLASVCSPYAVSMSVGVKQVGTLKTTGGRTVSAGTKFVINYTTETTTNRDGSTSEYYPAIDGTYFIYGIMDKYELFTQEDGTAFHATDCFDEATGELSELDLPYALYVPEDYSEDGKYMLVLHIEDAGFLGTDPMIALCESQAPANFASDEMQAYAEQQGYDGIIVVIPQIWDDIRTTRGGYTISCGVDATWQLMDYITDTYTAIDANRIYATGQSMGGMQVIAMAAQRDNYFAGILEMGCQWGTNYNKEVPNEGTVHYNIYDTDDPMITYELAENWFYAVSDDNILVTNCEGDSYSTSVWSEFAYLYYDIAGVEIPYATVSPLEQTDEEMSAVVEALVAQENETGIYWLSYTGGSHMLTWVYGHRIDASYYWLLSQTKESEDSRGKLEALNNPFAHMDAAEASEYIAGDFTHLPNGYDRLIATENSTGISYFYAVPADGAGTDGYNSAWMNRSGGTPSAGAGWNADTVYTVDSILITDGALTVAATLDANADYTVEVYAVAIGENEAELVASGILSSGADTFTSDALTAFAEDVIYTVVISDAGVVVASAMHLTLGEDSGEDETGYYVFACDNETAITDDSLSAWFDADSAAEGVEALLNAGKVYVNGFQIPAEESDDIAFKVNGFVSFYKDGDEWMNSVHKATSGETTFAAARTAFVEGLSLMSGLTVVLPYDENGYVTEIQFTVKESVAVEELIDNGDGTYSIDRSNFTLAVKEGMPDINDAVFAAVNVDAAVEAGCLALYWEATDGWHLERADSESGYLTDGQDHGYYIFNETYYVDSNITKYNLAKANRPGQFLEAHRTLGLFGEEITAWFVGDYPFGFTTNAPAAALELGIVNATAAKAEIVVSADGSDVATDVLWMTTDDLTDFEAQIAAAEAVLTNADSTCFDLDRAIYELAITLDAAAYGTAGGDENTAEIVSVYALGFVDTDGAKVEAIAVEYSADMSGADVNVDSYELELNSDSTGATAVYVNDTAAISETGGSGTGKYVIIEVDTDFLMSSEQTFTSSLAVGVTQTADISAGSVTAAASETAVTNYEETQTYNSYRDTWTTTEAAIYGQYEISGIEGFQFFTSNEDYGTPDGEPYHVEDCFDEKDGLSYDIDVAYALYVPEDYDASGSYAMVVVDNPATTEGTHPLVSVLETRSPALLASDWAQDLVKEQGLDGLIVVVPVVTARVDDNACTPAQYEALLALWDHIQDEYSIDENHVYGIGQSVGGMVLMETNRNRDNYFAAILMFENQWAQNYYKDTLFVRNQASSEETAATAPMHYPRTDAEVTWDYYFDEDGNKVYEDHDPYNLYYLISDDNIMVMNRSSNNLSNNTWQELSYLYTDLVGSSITHFTLDGNAEIAEQEALINEYLAEDASGLGLHWVTFENGTNGYSARKVLSGYEWLLSQTREDEMSRSKLDLNKPFELADEQIQTEERATSYTDTEGNTLYYLTGKAGAGTQFYNTSWLNLTTIADAAPGWLPEGMSWETGVEAAKIQSVTSIHDENGVLTAVAVEYDVDMTDAVIRLKGDEIIGLDGEVREDITIVLDPYDFYDAAGEQIECTISNVYINDSAAITADAERGSGTGCYVIVELDTDSTIDSVSLVQRMTIRTNTAIASATATVYSEVDGGNVEDTLRFDAASYEIKYYDYEGETIQVRFYENVQYCANPNAPDLQVMNIYVREDVADDYTAPIFLVQRTGQMKESAASTIETDGNGNLTSMLAMLTDGYVVVSPGARGQDTVVDGEYVGRGDLPMTIVDLKAAVRYLHYNQGVIPGDTEKIIAEGHSSGGGIIAVLGASGNSEYYEPYLEAIGAAPGRDDIYCCIVNSPIVDFAHIDFAYEWLFSVENVDGLFADDATSYAMSCALADEFEVWVDSLELKDPETGETIGFADGDTYTPYLIKMLNESATRFLSEMDEASRNEWLAASTNNVVNGSILTWDEASQTAEITSLEDYIGWNSGRWMKYIGCYDGGLTKASFEMPAFSTEDDDPGHFNARMWEIIGTFEGYEEYAESAYENALTHYWSEYLINPFNFIGTDEVCDTAPVWYLRCGGHNETTANQFLNLALVLNNKTDALVDFRYSWDMRHTWISDLEIEETLAFLDEVMSDGNEETTGTLKAGAGMAEMVFPQEYFEIVADDGTVSYEDGFNGQVYTFDSAYGEIVDNLCTRVLVLEDEIRVAIVAVEVAQTPDDQVAYTKKIVSEICGVDEDNVWVHCTHQFGFMHRPSDTEKAAVYDDIMKEALTAACEQAMETFQSAVLGTGIGDCYVSANKNIENPEGVTGGPYYGPGSTLETDTTLTMILFASAETGEDIGYFMSYGTKPSALCTTGKTVGNRQINTEVTGEACKIVEAAYSVPCLFCMPAAGDQYPHETAQYYGFDEDGNWGLIDIGFDEGIKIVEKLGAEMGDVAVNVASAIECDSNDADISLAATSFDYVNKAGDADMTITCDTLVIGDIALVGFKQEMDCVTGQQIQAASPYGTTLMVSFLNGDGKYFGHREAYDFNGGIGTWETNRSPYGIGAAEKFVEVAVELLGGEVTKDEEAETVMLQSVVANMGEDSTIDDSKYDGLYEEASAEDGIKAIIAAGEFYINGFAFPATAEAAADGFLVNQSTWLSAAEYADEEAYLAAAYTSVLNKGNNPYMQAAGTEYLLYDTDADSYADRIEMLYLEGIIVADYADNGDGTYSIDRGEFPDGLAVTGDKDGRTHDADHFAAGQEGYEVKAENFDAEIQPGDVALFSYTPDGWVLQRAIPVTGLFTNGADHDSYEIDGVSYEDAMKFSRDNIIVSNRNGEFTNAQKYFGFMNNTDGLTVTLWIAPTVGETVGAPVGMTSDGNSDTYLERAIAWAQTRLDAVEVSEDGSGLAVGTSYVSQAVHDELADVIASAQEVLESGCYDCIKDFQVYRLYLCLNGTGDDIGASFAGFSYTGFEDSIQTVAEAVEDGSSDAESEAADSENADAEPETAETDANSADAEPAEGSTEAESAEAEAADVEAEPDVTGETGDTEEEI
ncbi:MAG: hypothetical protein LIO55_08335 [Oscillospiraceae bacterium]|nr:hypothetical protein [Oscillospiraceae bacterium]